MVDVSIIIVNYKSKAKTAACLDSLRKSDVSSVMLDIIVVDNDAAQDVDQEFKARYPEVTFIHSEHNFGMGGGNNIGIRQARSQHYILILNPDTELKPDTIAEMVAYMENHPDVGLVGPRLLYPDGQTQQSIFRFPSLIMPLLRRTPLGKVFKKKLQDYLISEADSTQPIEVDWIMGSCLMIRKPLLDKIGPFDTRFFMYFEDTDLCKRIHAAGSKVIYYPLVDCIHHHGRGSAELAWYIAPFKNKLARVHIQSFLKYMWKWKFR